MISLSNDDKTLVLGTALWGWGIDENSAYQLIDTFVSKGGSTIDTASNYPINKRSEDFGLATRWVERWVKSNPGTDVSVIAKIGATDNSGSPDTDLSAANILATATELKDRLGHALSCVSVHWDNRGTEQHDFVEIEKTLEAMATLRQFGLGIGLSGIKFPAVYHKAKPELSEHWLIQVKENFTTRAARESYYSHFPNANYLAYGINLGGIKATPAKKNSSAELRKIIHSTTLIEKLSTFLASNTSIVPPPTSMNDLALAFIFANPALCGVIIGPRNKEQLLSTLSYWDALRNTFDHADHSALLASLAEHTHHG